MKKNILILFFFSYCQSFPFHCKAQISPLSSIIKQEENNGNFSGVVLIAKGDSVVFIKGAGFADREANILNDTNTIFNIASTGKLFTRIVILQLIQEGKLSLDDKIGKFFDGFDQPNADQITILHLLEHTSGLGDVYVSDEYLQPENYSSVSNVVKLIAKEKLKFAPGSGDRYSNSGYYLLAAIASKIEGKPFENVYTERILSPLNMSNTGFAKTGDMVPYQAIPYAMKRGKIVRPKTTTVGEPPTGAGSEYSTVSDLFKIYRSIIKDEVLLSDKSKAILFNHFKPGDWNEILQSGKITGYLGGDTRGWSAKLSFMFYKQSPYAVIILANFNDMAHPLDLKLREAINKSLE